MNKELLGKGAYGQVLIKNGNACKKFKYLSHLIQEYTALNYLRDCQNVVNIKGVSFEDLELYMDLYDCNLREWLIKYKNPTDIMKIIHDILLGLIELHDRSMAHGDLKPTNILIKLNPLKAVLGDCGFSSIAKYSKVDRTAPLYQEQDITFASTHDMYSLGICLIELLCNFKIKQKPTYHQLKIITEEKISNNDHRKIIANLVNEDKSKRYTSRELFSLLFNESPKKWIKRDVLGGVSISEENRNFIKKLFSHTCHEFNIHRGFRGYKALLIYLDNHRIDPKEYKLYIGVTLMILSSLFGESGFREDAIIELCPNKYNKNDIYKVLKNILSNDLFVNGILCPPKDSNVIE